MNRKCTVTFASSTDSFSVTYTVSLFERWTLYASSLALPNTTRLFFMLPSITITYSHEGNGH